MTPDRSQRQGYLILEPALLRRGVTVSKALIDHISDGEGPDSRTMESSCTTVPEAGRRRARRSYYRNRAAIRAT
jgi:hypothetical protein